MERNIQFLIDSLGLTSAQVRQPPVTKGLSNTRSVYEGLSIRPEIEAEFISYLGTPVVCPVVLKSQDESLSLRIDTVLCRITMQKNIVNTTLQGVNGTVKEYVSDGDYDIIISGLLTAPKDRYPRQDTITLQQLCKLPEALIVESDFLQLFGIYNLVIQSYSFAQQEGQNNTQQFELQCLSDKPAELIIEDETLN